MNTTFTVEAVGTQAGRAVIFLRGSDQTLRTVPTDIVSMAELAASGIRIRNEALPRPADRKVKGGE